VWAAQRLLEGGFVLSAGLFFASLARFVSYAVLAGGRGFLGLAIQYYGAVHGFNLGYGSGGKGFI
jgi:hypothetical protein